MAPSRARPKAAEAAKAAAPKRPGGIAKPRASRKPRTPLTSSPALATDAADLPEVDGAPPAWADDRASLGSALPWFNRMQGGMGYKDDICWGFFIDGDCGARSYVDDEVVITRIGGSSGRDTDGNLVLLKDQDESDVAVRCIRHSMEAKIAVGMVIGSKNTALKRKLPHRFNVMAYFRVVQIWCEKVNGKTAFKVRLEKLDLSGKSWWAEKGSPTPVPHAHRLTQLEALECPSCLTSSVRMYKEGWMCLTSTCPDFWTLAGTEPPVDLTFDQKYLECRAPQDFDIAPHYSLVPDVLSMITNDDPHVALSRIAWKRGIVCPLCQKCIARRFWNGYKCSDDTAGDVKGKCPFEKWLKIHPVPLWAATDSFESSPIKRGLYFDPKTTIVMPEIDDHSFAPYRVVKYDLGEPGFIMHFVSNRAINSRPNGPDDLFQQLQLEELGLRRHPMGQAVVPGTLTAQFAVNYGLPYKFVVAVDSRGFNEACDPILRTLGRLTWATKNAVASQGGTALDPNEVLLLGYVEGQKIGYHDDGESSLGPTISSLSLGSPATMAVRMKSRFYHGHNKPLRGEKVHYADDPVLKFCANYDERLRLRTELLNGTLSEENYTKAWWDSYKESKKSVTPPDLIRIQLNHGDMVTMHGEDLQKYFEHGVEVEEPSKLRFALTARYVKKEEVAEEDWSKGNFTLTSDQVYDGDCISN
ncbi:hypothetical protein BDW62DRAFT_3143 [Aspergillus aurantiobrunneus]